MEVPQSGPPRQQPAAKKQHRSTSKTTAHQTVAQLVMALPLFSAKNSSVQCLGVNALFKHSRRGSRENGKRLGWQFSYILVTSSSMNIGNFQGDGDHRKAREEHPPTYQRRLCLHPLMFELIAKSIYQHSSRFHDERMVNFRRGPTAVPELHKHLRGICGRVLKDCSMPRLDFAREQHPHSLTLLE